MVCEVVPYNFYRKVIVQKHVLLIPLELLGALEKSSQSVFFFFLRDWEMKNCVTFWFVEIARLNPDFLPPY